MDKGRLEAFGDGALVVVDRDHGAGAHASPLAALAGRATRERLSIVLYLVAIPLALIITPWFACALYAAVAALWFVPDRRMEKIVAP